MRRTTQAVIRIVSCLVVVMFAISAFHAARERNLQSVCLQIGLMLSLIPYAVYPERSPFLHHGRQSVRDAVVSVSRDVELARRPGSLFISMSVGSMIFVGIGLALLVYDHFVK